MKAQLHCLSVMQVLGCSLTLWCRRRPRVSNNHQTEGSDQSHAPKAAITDRSILSNSSSVPLTSGDRMGDMWRTLAKVTIEEFKGLPERALDRLRVAQVSLEGLGER